jgi:hypothetical protein
VTEETRRPLPVTGIVFVVVMLAAGFGLAFLFKAHPTLAEAVPGLMWLLGVALVFDVAANALAMRGHGAALTMPWRVGGFCAGAVLHHLVVINGA